jgi:hypothetical protein
MVRSLLTVKQHVTYKLHSTVRHGVVGEGKASRHATPVDSRGCEHLIRCGLIDLMNIAWKLPLQRGRTFIRLE